MSSPTCPSAHGWSLAVFRFFPLLSPPGCVRRNNSTSQKCWLREAGRSGSQECGHGLPQVAEFGDELDELIHALDFRHVRKNISRVLVDREVGERLDKRGRVARK